VQFGEGAGLIDSPGASSVAVSATFTGTGTYRSYGALGTRLVQDGGGGGGTAKPVLFYSYLRNRRAA
jgi:hypothetical protein